MNEFLATPSLIHSVIYYASCLLNFVAALWIASSFVRMRETDIWILRLAMSISGLTYVMIAISMFKNPEYAPHATNLIWWWIISVFGLLVLLQPTGMISATIIRVGTYIGAAVAVWGSYIVASEQAAFGELATYYGFFGANLAAATWMLIGPMMNEDMLRQKRIIIMGTGAIYAVLVVTGLQTMQMILETPY